MPITSINTIKAYQGMECDVSPLPIVDINTGLPLTFGSSTTLKGYVWQGQNQSTIFAPTITWYQTTGYQTGQIALAIAGTQTSGLDPAGEYSLLITTTTSGVESPAIRALLKILATPGTTTPTPPDLISYDYCLSQLSVIPLTPEQLDLLPWLIASASQAVRLECNNRYFDLRTLTEWHEVYQDGFCRLWQEPIQIVTRVQGNPQQQVLTISNTASSVQTAQAYFSYTGFDGGYNTNAKTATGIVLNWVSNGVASSANPLYASNPTINQMATAINAIGSGWSAQVASGYGSWACTELTGGFVAQGCAENSSPTRGAQFNVLSDLTIPKLRPRSPMLWVGRQYSGNQLAQQFGPGGYEMFGGDDEDFGLVKVTYVAGFPTIPPDVQFQTAQLVKWRIELGIQELLLKAENADDYNYDLATELVHNMPRPVREALGKYKYHYA